MPRKLLALSIFALLTALAACGGGGGSGGGGSSALPTSAPQATIAPGTNNLPLQSIVLGGTAWTTTSGMTLYTFAVDTANTSNCLKASGCTTNWPPLTATAGATAVGNFVPITRSDGGLQWSDNGAPLYTFIGDTKAGDANGNGVNAFGGIWTVARPPTSTGGTGGTGASCGYYC